MSNTSTLVKEADCTLNSSLPSNNTETLTLGKLVETWEQEEPKHYTLGLSTKFYREDAGVFVLEGTINDRIKLQRLGEELALILKEFEDEDEEDDKRLILIGCNTSKNTFVVTYDWSVVLERLFANAFNDLILYVTTQKIEIFSVDNILDECISPYRLLGDCKSCVAEKNKVTNLGICRPLKSDGSPIEIDVEELEQYLKDKKYPKILNYKWCSPLYTKVDNQIKNNYRLRYWKEHDFDNVEELRNRHSKGSTTRAYINKKEKELCSRCTLKKACKGHYKYKNHRMHINFCQDFRTVTEEETAQAYLNGLKQKKFDRESFSILSWNAGEELRWRHNRFKIHIILEEDYDKGFKAKLQYARRPHAYAIIPFDSLSAAVQYLRNHDKKHTLELEDTHPITDDQLALYCAASYNIRRSPTFVSGWRSTEYSLRYISRSWSPGITVGFSTSRGEELYWKLNLTSIYEIYEYYGRAHFRR